jgi:predicted MFS family arabinose efflux permease
MRALRIRDFRLLWTAGLVSSIGSWLLVIAVPAHVYLTTGSLSATGLTQAAEYLPLLLFAPAAGFIVDRFDRRRLMIASDLFRAGAVALLLPASGHARALVYVSLAAEGAGSALFTPALRARVPAIVGTGADLTSANAISTATNGVIPLLGGPLGGALFAFAGFTALVLTDIASYLISAVVLLRTSRYPGRPEAGGSTSRPAGRWLDQPTSAMLIVAFMFFISNATLNALLVPFAIRRLGGSAAAGVLILALGAGFLCGAWLVRIAMERMRHLLPVVLAASSLGYFALFHSPSLACAVAAAAWLGSAGSIVLASIQTAVQRTVPDVFLGRAAAAFVAADAAASLAGAFTGPALAGAGGFGGAASIASLVTLAAGIVAFAVLPPVSRVVPHAD